MKQSRFLTSLLVIATLFFFAACGSSGNSADKKDSSNAAKTEQHDHSGHDHGDATKKAGGDEANADKTGKEYTSAYICPMHCKGSGSDKMGKCPVCGMDYVANKDHKADGHNH